MPRSAAPALGLGRSEEEKQDVVSTTAALSRSAFHIAVCHNESTVYVHYFTHMSLVYLWLSTFTSTSSLTHTKYINTELSEDKRIHFSDWWNRKNVWEGLRRSKPTINWSDIQVFSVRQQSDICEFEPWSLIVVKKNTKKCISKPHCSTGWHINMGM